MAETGRPIFPAEAYRDDFIQLLLRRLYKEGQIPTREENLFLLSLKSHPSAFELATRLLQPGRDFYVHQFAANLLTQVFESAQPDVFTDETVDRTVAVLSEISTTYGSDPLGTKIRRQLMTSLGVALRSNVNYRSKFDQLLLSIQPDFFQSISPNPVALDVFYVFTKFGRKKNANFFDFFVAYFMNLFQHHFHLNDPQQAVYLKFLGDWLRDVEDFDTPTAEMGRLMVQVGRFVDCPERQTLAWGAIQAEAASTLEVFLGLTDFHLLQNSLIELLHVINSYPILFRAQTMSVSENGQLSVSASRQELTFYFDVIVKVFLNFTLEFSDIIISCWENENTKCFLFDFVERLRWLADPFPEREFLSPVEETFSDNAIIAFSELSSVLFQMCGNASEVAVSLLPQFNLFFKVLVKKALLPPKNVSVFWSHEEQEKFREMRRNVQKAIENLSLAVGNSIYFWIDEEFIDAFRLAESSGNLSKLVAVCWVFRFSYSSKAQNSSSFPSLLLHLQKTFGSQNKDCIFQVFKAMEVWLPCLQDCGYESNLLPFVSIICSALSLKDSALTTMCGGTLAALIEVLPKHISQFYTPLSEGIVANLTSGTGTLSARATLLKCLGHLIARLLPNQAAAEIDKVFPVFSKMLTLTKTGKGLSATISILPGFFRAVGADTVEIPLSVHTVIYEAVARLGVKLLSHLHEAKILNTENKTDQTDKTNTSDNPDKSDNPDNPDKTDNSDKSDNSDMSDTSVKADMSDMSDDVCSALIKDILYACGPAGKELLPAVVPVVGQFFTRNPTPAVLNLITELLTVHLDGVDEERLFGQLCIYVFTSVIQLGKKENWKDFVNVFASFVLTAYPVIRSSAARLVNLDMDWEGLLNLVIKLLIFLPVSGDSESVVQSNLIFEELLRMKPKDPIQTEGSGGSGGSGGLGGFVNPIKTLLENGYGLKLVEQFLKVFCDSSTEDEKVKMSSDCFFVMLTEMNTQTKAWLKQVPPPLLPSPLVSPLVQGGDSLQQAAFERFLSVIILQRNKSSLARHVKTYRQKFRSLPIENNI